MSQTVPGAAPPWTTLQAPAHWRSIDFISDLHLQAGHPATFDAWRDYMQRTPSDAVFILGDLFDVWVGDDVLPATDPDQSAAPDDTGAFEWQCVQVLQATARRLDTYLMHGNRDFLIGHQFATRCGVTLLGDPAILQFGGQRWLLSHGDALCLDDHDYLQFRAKVRAASWQRDFLGKPLSERCSIATDLRQQSEAHKRGSADYTDIDDKTACDWLRLAGAQALIHGHTHQPAEHPLCGGLRRHVLSDWDASAKPARVEILRLGTPGAPQQRCSLQRLRG